MGFWSGFFKSFAKDLAREMLQAGLTEAIEKAHAEIDSRSTSEEEKQWMKKGLALTVKRLEDYVAEKL